MSTDESSDPAQSQGGADSIAERLSRLSDRFLELVDAITPENTDLMEKGVKVAFSLILTLLFIYWVMAYQFEVVWFEF